MNEFYVKKILMIFCMILYASLAYATPLLTSGDADSDWVLGYADPGDLLQTDLANITSTGDFTLVGFGATVESLNNGIMGWYTGWAADFASWQPNASVTYYLDTMVNTYGYDITNIHTYAGYAGNGRDAQQYSIYYSLIGSENWYLFDSIDWNTPDASQFGTCMNKVEWSLALQNVDAIQFVAPDSLENGWTVLCEIDVIGTPSSNPITIVSAGESQNVWLNNGMVDVSLNGTVTSPSSYTVLWSVVSQPAGNAVVFTPATTEDTSVRLYSVGTYVFRLAVQDGVYDPSETTIITVYEDACAYAQVQPGFAWHAADGNHDCEVNIQDLMFISENWLGTYTTNFGGIVQDGEPYATIIIAQNPTPSAKFAALELQYHIKRITGAVLPIIDDSQAVTGNRILVGHSTATSALGIHVEDFGPLEYRIQHTNPGVIILVGRDWQDTPANRAEVGRSTSGWTLQAAREVVNYNQITSGFGPSSVELPGMFDDQGTCYAVYDFLERFCGVRWYGPKEVSIVSPSKKTLTVTWTGMIQRSKDLKLVDGYGPWQIGLDMWHNPTPQEERLYYRRMRAGGGERWASNHTLPGVFLSPPYPADFASPTRSDQICFTHPGVIQAVADQAAAYFNGGNPPCLAMGDTFAIAPADGRPLCTCTRWTGKMCPTHGVPATCHHNVNYHWDGRGGDNWQRSGESYPVFWFVNEIAKIVHQTNPDKYIAPLAYWWYFYKPLNLTLESNIAPAPTLVTCQLNDPGVQANNLAAWNEWVAHTQGSGRRLYMWNYFHWPYESTHGYHCFPNFIPHGISTELKRYINGGARGVYLCGVPQQVDFYIYLKTAFDKTTDVDALLDEFFTSYFGVADVPMKQFYLSIENILQVEGVIGRDPDLSWGRLGTPTRMAELEGYINQAMALSATAPSLIQQRVNAWKVGVWDSMKGGFDEYYGN